MSTAVALALVTAAPALGDSPAQKTAYQAGPYSVSDSGTTDLWTCTGFRLDAGSTVQDHFHCTVTDQTFTGTFTKAKLWPCGCSGWMSDYDGTFATDYVIRVSSNGTVAGTAIYQR